MRRLAESSRSPEAGFKNRWEFLEGKNEEVLKVVFMFSRISVRRAEELVFSSSFFVPPGSLFV